MDKVTRLTLDKIAEEISVINEINADIYELIEETEEIDDEWDIPDDGQYSL